VLPVFASPDSPLRQLTASPVDGGD
jgi:hypothetical protein